LVTSFPRITVVERRSYLLGTKFKPNQNHPVKGGVKGAKGTVVET